MPSMVNERGIRGLPQPEMVGSWAFSALARDFVGLLFSHHYEQINIPARGASSQTSAMWDLRLERNGVCAFQKADKREGRFVAKAVCVES